MNTAGLNEKQATRAQFRSELFKRRGMEADLAEATAKRLVLRDSDLDSRRLCDECSHYRFRNFTCAKNLPISPEQQLIHCHGFSFVTP